MDPLFITVIILSLISLSIIILSIPLIFKDENWGFLTFGGVVGLACALGFGLGNFACRPKTIIVSVIQPTDVLKSNTTKYIEFNINDKIYKFSYSDKYHYDNDSLEFYHVKYYDFYGDNEMDSILKLEFYKDLPKDTPILYKNIPKRADINFQKNF